MPELASGVPVAEAAVEVVLDAAEVVLVFTVEVSLLDVTAVVDDVVLTVEIDDKVVLTLMLEVDVAAAEDEEEISSLAPNTLFVTRAPTDDFR